MRGLFAAAGMTANNRSREDSMPIFKVIKDWIRQITEVGLLLVALVVVIQVIFGQAWFAAGDVVGNLISVINSFGENGIVGLIALVIVLWLFANRKVD